MTAKPNPNPLQEAQKLAAAIAKIDKREQVTMGNAAMRYQAERNALFEAASPVALRLYEASKSEVAG